jgi:diacylglycerol kinase (ATP)
VTLAAPDPKTPSFVPRGPLGALRALRWSLNGLRQAFLAEHSFRLEVYAFVVLGPVAFWLGATPVERVILFGSLLLVLAVELLNSAVESVADKTTPEFNELIGRAKDMGSAAVLLTLVNVVVCWLLILLPRYL